MTARRHLFSKIQFQFNIIVKLEMVFGGLYISSRTRGAGVTYFFLKQEAEKVKEPKLGKYNNNG